MYPLYSLLYLIGLLILFIPEYLKRPRGMRSLWLSEKLGNPAIPPSNGQPTLWVHAVSVGEAAAAAPFVRAYKSRYPGRRVIVSTITDTGRAVASERMSGIAEVIYLPFDLGFLVRRAVRRLRPVLFVVMETELWPNLLRVMREEGVSAVLLNGRISEGSFKGYRMLRPAVRRVLGCFDAICMQDEGYAERALLLGAARELMHVTGNFKFDITVSGGMPEWAGAISGPVVLIGSTHAGEEEMMARVYARLRQRHPDINLVIAPRHPHRFDEVCDTLGRLGITCKRRSAMTPDAGLKGIVVVLDTVGELAGAYSIADIAVMGGSFIPHGGQNPLEAAFWAKPVLCGPHMRNFPFVREFYESGAALEASGEGQLHDLIERLLGSPDERAEMGRKAKALLEKNRGAVERAIAVISSLDERAIKA